MFYDCNCLTLDHDWYAFLPAAFVCLLASAVAVSLFHRAQATEGRTRFMWLSLNAAAAGCGIWATHFIAMLAYTPAIGIEYDIALTVTSLLIAVLITGAGLGMALLDLGRWRTVVGGAVVGGGIAAMHYTGMMALEFAGRVTWSTDLTIASIVIGMTMGVLAVHFAARRDDWPTSVLAVVLLTLAILFVHFIGMSAVMILPDPAHVTDAAALSSHSFSHLIAGATTIILGLCLVAALSDRKWEGAVRRQKHLLDTALDNMLQGLCMFDADGRILLFNRRYGQMVGLPADRLKNATLLDVIKHRNACGEIDEDPEEFTARVIATARAGKSNGRTVETSTGRAIRIIENPRQEGGWVSTLEDITEWREVQARISHMAHHDGLTDLANRTQLIKKLNEEFAALPARGGSIAAYLIDLDRFKSVNDTFGRDVGDLLLKTVAERLRAAAGADDTVARLGGDEFVVIQSGVADENQAEDFARRLAAAISPPVQFKEQIILPSPCIGVALAPADGANPERLLKSADLALYKAKAEGRNCIRFFVREMDAELEARTKLERTIREAVLHNRFELHYQPLFELSGRRLVGFEALVRLPAEDGTLIPPMDFIPLAEELQLIDKIGEWVLQEACRTAALWPANLTVAVNLSPAQFEKGSISSVVAAALEDSGLTGNRLELEITESLLLGESAPIMADLHSLRALGVRIVMDDFGTGYSSLGYLWRFPFDKIKIDRSFMQGFDSSGQDAKTIVKTIIALGRELKMRVTVEGVETATQAEFLDQVEGDQAQGYFFGRPIPGPELAASILKDFQGAGASPERPSPLVKMLSAGGA